MSLITLNVNVVGGIRPKKPITPLEIANLVAPYLGKKFTVTIQSNQTPQQLANMVDELLGVSPGLTFEETLIEAQTNQVLDNSKTLQENGVTDGDNIQYRFFLNYD
jgi:hypothetical protein